MKQPDSLQTIVDASERLKIQSKLAILRMDRALARLLAMIEDVRLTPEEAWVLRKPLQIIEEAKK